MNAREANFKTKQALEKINAPLIEECLKLVYSKIDEAIRKGKFVITSPLTNLTEYNDDVKAKVYQILTDRQYKVECSNDGYDDYYVNISWKDIKNEP